MFFFWLTCVFNDNIFLHVLHRLLQMTERYQLFAPPGLSAKMRTWSHGNWVKPWTSGPNRNQSPGKLALLTERCGKRWTMWKNTGSLRILAWWVREKMIAKHEVSGMKCKSKCDRRLLWQKGDKNKPEWCTKVWLRFAAASSSKSPSQSSQIGVTHVSSSLSISYHIRWSGCTAAESNMGINGTDGIAAPEDTIKMWIK